MRKLTMAAALAAVLALVSIDADSAEANTAWGLSIGGGSTQFTVGSYDPFYYRAPYQASYRRAYSNPRWYGYPPVRETRRYDVRRYAYVPGGFVPPNAYCDTGSRYDRDRFDRGPRDYRGDRDRRDGRDGRRR